MKRIPNLHQAVIDSDMLETLFRDVAAFGSNIEVTPKGGSKEHAGGASMTLTESQTALRGAAIQAVQLRYDHQGDRWCDTIMPAEDGWRLTRINLAEAASIAAE